MESCCKVDESLTYWFVAQKSQRMKIFAITNKLVYLSVIFRVFKLYNDSRYFNSPKTSRWPYKLTHWQKWAIQKLHQATEEFDMKLFQQMVLHHLYHAYSPVIKSFISKKDQKARLAFANNCAV